MNPKIRGRVRFRLRMGAPKHKHLWHLIVTQRLDHRVSERFPSVFGVARRPASFNRQTGVKQEHALVRPGCQVAVRRQPQWQVAVQLFEDVAQAGRHLLAPWHGESQTLGLPLAVIWVLAEDGDAHLIARGQLQRAQHLRRVDRSARSLALTHKGFELASGG